MTRFETPDAPGATEQTILMAQRLGGFGGGCVYPRTQNEGIGNRTPSNGSSTIAYGDDQGAVQISVRLSSPMSCRA